MISVSQVTVSFGGGSLFEDISFLINPRDRIGLAGKNGAGKSTLLKILAGQQKPESGTISMPGSCTVGYLPQDMVHKNGKTVYDETSEAFSELKRLERKIADLSQAMSERTDYESESYMQLITDLHESEERFSLVGGYTMQADIETVLLGLGFMRTDFTRLTNDFSGGWRMRIELAKILLQKPEVMLLDEPTNHLDIESIQWLEDFLKNYAGAIVLVSHDKAFLDAITTRTIEISMGQIFDYKANYSKYLELRKERREQQEAAAKNQEKYIEHTEELINKFRAKKNKAAFAQSLIKKLDKLEKIEVDDEDTSTIRFRFPPAPRSGKVVLEAADLGKSYGDKVIFDHVNFAIERGEKIAFVGKNGEGKSTLVRIITEGETHRGKLQPGYNVSIGYYAQNQAEKLDPEKTVFETIDDEAQGDMRKNVRNLLGSFLFSGDTVEKKVKVLSGGERARLALCKLILQPHNMLILDEPTNHLDIRSKEVLKKSLLEYDGSLIIVSHDRDFLKGLTQKVFEFTNKTVKEHIGDIYDLIQLKKLNIDEKKKAAEAIQEAPKAVNVSNEKKREQDKEIKRLQSNINKSEKEISRLEAEMLQMDEQLMDPEKYKEAVKDKDIFSKYEQVKRDLEKEMENWESLNLQLEKVRN